MSDDLLNLLEAEMNKTTDLINEQAEDEGLWSLPLEGLQPVTEACLQQELRKLHDVVEKLLVNLEVYLRRKK